MSDMDLLFRERDLEQVQALLFELGYTRSVATRPIADFLEGSELPTFERLGSANLDVHMRIERASAPFSIDCDGLWERAHPWPLDGRPLLALSPEDLLLHLCLHATFHHRFRARLHAMTDIARVAEVEPLNWRLFVERACDWQAELPVFMGLSLARRLAAATIPEDVLSPLPPRNSEEAELVYAEQTILAVRHDGHHEKVLASRRTRQWHYLHRTGEISNLPRWRAKLWYLLSKVFPSKASLLCQYPWFSNSGWVRIMYSVHWLVITGRLVRAMASDRRSWLAWQRLGRRWSS